ncbi:MAG: hypothetical protein EA397_13350 [Deltaproteobacteria bacterium]|nr:MAG: hypothetical protein EA397_13350 [Deltaproteobacteria bacterium]
MAERTYVWLGIALVTGVGLAALVAMSGAFVAPSSLEPLGPAAEPVESAPAPKVRPPQTPRPTAPPVAPPSQAEAPPPTSVRCKIIGDDPNLAMPDAEIYYQEPDLDDPEHLPSFSVELREGMLVFEPPEGVVEGVLRAEGFLEVRVRWSGSGCTPVRPRPAATVVGRVEPSWGEPRVIGCGTSGTVAEDGRFELSIPPGSCDMRAIWDDDGVIVTSEPARLDVQAGQRVEVLLVLP